MASKETVAGNHRSDTMAIDAAVLDGCRAGDRVAQQRLYELCHRQVYGLMVRLVGRQDATDLTQQVFLQLFGKIGKFEGRSNFATWLHRFAINEALQHLRRGRRHNARSLIDDPICHSESEEVRQMRKELLEQALERLDPELRSIFVLREVEGFSYRAIAEAIEIPEGTVGSRLNRARRELQQHLIELGWEP